LAGRIGVEVEMRRVKFAAALAALGLISNAAAAADLPYYSAPARSGSYMWQGPYVGANLGYQWSSISNTGAKPDGIAGGVQAGYNVQSGQFVFGGETDLQVTGANDTFAPWKFSNPWFGTLRARGGYAMNTFLFYGTVGLAYGSLTMKNTLTTVSESHTSAGWTAGAGVEAAIWGNWTARVEYLYVDLGSSSFVLDGTSHGIQSNVLRVGVNYRF
jgi:outer membrane immunogenic protein